MSAPNGRPKHTVVLEYCAPCNYLNLALEATRIILSQWGPHIGSLKLLPSAWGTFELTVNDELVFSKWATGRHPREGELLEILENRMGPPLVDWEDHAPEMADANGVGSW